MAWGKWCEYLDNMITCWCKCEASNRSLLQTRLLISFMNIHKCTFLCLCHDTTVVSVSHLLTERQHPPRGLQGLVHHVVGLHADGLQLRLTLCLYHFDRYLKQMSPILFEKHAVPSVTICLCVCSDLLCSSLLLSLLSSLSFLASLWDSDPGGSQQSQREAVGCGGNFKWMNEICGFISLLWCWWIGVMGINSLPREVLT